MTINRWLERHDASALIHTIVGRDTLLALKPSPAMVLEALRRCGADPDDAIFVGDSTADLGAAQAAGDQLLRYRDECAHATAI